VRGQRAHAAHCRGGAEIRFGRKLGSNGVCGSRALIKAELENEVWQLAARSYREKVVEILAAALAAYARPPGHDDLTRVHMSGVGREAFAALRAYLGGEWRNSDPVAEFLWLRNHKREYLYYVVLRRLVMDELASEQIRDSLFSMDVGA